MVQIISELLEFSRNTYTAFDYASIERIVNDAVKSMEHIAGDVDIQIINNCPPHLPHLRSNNLFQVFCNLVKNAVDAMQGTGQLKISTNLIDDKVVVEFRDSGPGFPPENAQAIFEPFFTTKTHGSGTGLGLAICKDIIEKYNGKITAENDPEQGSIFTVYIPLTKEITERQRLR